MLNSRIAILLALILLLSFSLASAYTLETNGCLSTCKSQGYAIGKCSTFVSGCDHGWVHEDAGGACSPFGISSKCCCSNEYKDLDATGMCTLVVKSAVAGGGMASPFTCDKSNEIVNYYNEGNSLAIECKDCGAFGCEAYTKRTIMNDPGPGYTLLVESVTPACEGSETVPQGNSDKWGYDYTSIGLCGNGALDSGEVCDGSNLNGNICTSVPGGFTGGTLKCSATCTFDTSSCIGGGPVVTTTTIGPTNRCEPGSAPKCTGLALQACENMGTYYDWKTVESPSLQCCTDGDCGASKCGTAWLSGKADPIAPLARGGFCCGDDGDADLGTLFDGNKLCVKDGSFQWITGVNATRYLNNRLLYCDRKFTFCINETPYYTVDVVEPCEPICKFYCEPSFNKWLSNTAPEGLDILNESLKTGERIDTEKFDLSGKSGCCPATWCWNGEQCIENQIDEPLNLKVLKDSIGKPNRCLDGAWATANLTYSWDYRFAGYCPQKDSQCLVSNISYANNNKPETYFSAQKPQCIGAGQYILDYYCTGSKWQSRTSLVAAKMLDIGGTGTRFKLFCDDYSITLNDYDYRILNTPVLNYLSQSCQLNSQRFNCVNNFCVLRNMDTGNVLLGASLNVPLEDPTMGIGRVLGVSGCATPSANGDWDYGSCGVNAIYNPQRALIIFSSSGVISGSAGLGWSTFRSMIRNPLMTVTDLVIRGQIQFQTAAGLQIRFNVLNTSKMFSRLYIADYGGNKRVQGIFENSRFDKVSQKPKHYLLLTYENWGDDICSYVNNYTLSLDRRLNCKRTTVLGVNKYVVLDEREVPSLLMERWTDLTSKFK